MEAKKLERHTDPRYVCPSRSKLDFPRTTFYILDPSQAVEIAIQHRGCVIYLNTVVCRIARCSNGCTGTFSSHDFQTRSPASYRTAIGYRLWLHFLSNQEPHAATNDDECLRWLSQEKNKGMLIQFPKKHPLTPSYPVL